MLTQPSAPTARTRRRRGIAAALAAASAAASVAVFVPTASAIPPCITVDLGPLLTALHARDQVNFTLGELAAHTPLPLVLGLLSDVVCIKT